MVIIRVATIGSGFVRIALVGILLLDFRRLRGSRLPVFRHGAKKGLDLKTGNGRVAGGEHFVRHHFALLRIAHVAGQTDLCAGHGVAEVHQPSGRLLLRGSRSLRHLLGCQWSSIQLEAGP